MKRNGMCPICFIKKYLGIQSKAKDLKDTVIYDNGTAKTPPMGWSSWNTFRNNINEEVIYDMALAMKNTGLLDVGYKYVNLDDNWHSSERDENGELQGDLSRFPHGIPALVQNINKLGLKVGIYSSNGTKTCENLPASLYNEKKDTLTFAKWGIEYFKYDFCHNEKIPQYAPIVYGITVFKPNSGIEGTFYPCNDAEVTGTAKIMPNKRLVTKKNITGLDGNSGSATFKNIKADEDGNYILTIDCFKKGFYQKFLFVEVNEKDIYQIYFPEQRKWNTTSRFQTTVKLNKGDNAIKLYNPVSNNADSAFIQYRNMAYHLKNASKSVAMATNSQEKPICFSICEWGFRKPWTWGKFAGNVWRTTPDIRPIWTWIMIIYSRTVKLYEYASIGHWNDPDMLEVGNGKLTKNENIAHFSTWCMLNAPLILGNDLRKITPEVLDIVTNKDMIAINQDSLGKQAKRIKKGGVDILAKPLADGSTAVLFLNKFGPKKSARLNISKLISDSYIGLKDCNKYRIKDIWNNTETEMSSTTIKAKVSKHSAVVYIITPEK